MEYSNPEIPEGINTTTEHPLKEFLILLIGVLLSITLVVMVISFMAERLVVYIPFSTERELLSGNELYFSDEHPEVKNYLQELANKLSPIMGLPEDMIITVHYLDQDIENAYASLGGHIYIYRGLLKLLTNENALAMVIAHEIAHIKHRHPIMAMGRGVVIGLFLATIAGISGDRFVGQVVNDAGIITLLGFNRNQEQEADTTALYTIDRYYGHIGGSDTLFNTLLTQEKNSPLHTPEFLSTHPLGEKRIQYFQQLADENNWDKTGELTAIPDNILATITQTDN